MARSGGLEAIAGALRCWQDYPMVQLCALLCMVPLALDNNVLQVRSTPLCLGRIAGAQIQAGIWCGLDFGCFTTPPC